MRMWEIKEKDHKSGRDYRMGMRHDKSWDEAYECGYEDGYEDAMKELEDNDYNERSYRRSMRMR